MWCSLSFVSLATKPPAINQCTNLINRRQAHSFFDSKSAKELWKSVTSVSNQGRMRGRAKGMLRIKDLHRGQKLGMGKNRMRFPGLTTGIRPQDGASSMKIEQVPKEDYEQYLEDVSKTQASMTSAKKGQRYQTPLERGWTSASPQGKKYGPPESSDPDSTTDDFQSILLETRRLCAMTGNFGRVMKTRMCMVTGNGNGLLGMAVLTVPFGSGMGGYRRCVNRAGRRVVFIDRYENRTVYHDFFSQYGASRLFVQQKAPGYGIKADRMIKAACELVGIKDIRVIVEGRRSNKLNILKAFIIGLLRQRTHQELANEKKLHLVEMRAEMGNYPLVVASPEDGVVRTEEEIGKDEILDFEAVGFDGHYARIEAIWQLPEKSARRKLQMAPYNHQAAQRHRLLLEEGEIKSFLTDKFPECKPLKLERKKERIN